ncbi:MAG: sugar phosphate nucleotidyltransferase [Lachnospiraceae bacterium]|nr:sugar phosphate nucleotidyltransferase [Lachnospiraceae bacterium]
MDQKPVLVIMAAGMGSRYGGLKQIDPIDEYGNLIIDFSIYDAIEAGFEKVVFIIKHAIEKEFKEQIGNRIAKQIQVEYVFQELNLLPEGYEVPKGRQKPWGTGHAILCCAPYIQTPFAVINADDYYGKSAFSAIYRQLCSMKDDSICHYTMVGYELYKTLTDHGHVARGICSVNEAGMLTDIQERTRIEKRDGIACYSPDEGMTWNLLSEETTVSMNLWGFTPSIFPALKQRFHHFLDQQLPVNPLKCEYFLPFIVDEMLKEGKADVKVLASPDSWYGVTYKEDKEKVVAAIRALKDQGQYPKQLWKEAKV